MSIAIAVLAGLLAVPAPLLVLQTRDLAPERGDLVCRVENSSEGASALRVEALDARGVVVYDSGAFHLAAGAVFLTGGGFSARSCRFTVRGSLDGVRAEGLLLGPEGDAPREVLPALTVVARASGTSETTASENGQRERRGRGRE